MLFVHFPESSHDNNDVPIFRQTQQTSQDTEQWSFRDHGTLSDEESLPLRPVEILDSEASNEDTARDSNFEPETELKYTASQSPNNQSGFIYLHPLQIENGDYESEPQQQGIPPGTSRKVNTRPQLNKNDGHENEPQQQHVNKPGPSRNENSHPQQNQNDGHGCESQQPQIIPPAKSRKVNSRPQPNENNGRYCEPQQHDILPGPSQNENYRPQLNQNDGRICEPQQQQVIRPGPSRNENSCPLLNQNGGRGRESQQLVNRSGRSRDENSRPQLHPNPGHGSVHSQQQYAALTGPSALVDSRKQSSQSPLEMPNAGDFVNIFFINKSELK